MLRRLVLSMLIASPVLAQQHPNVERGFQADKVYRFSGVDNVNLYNGNLALRIPIGDEFPGNGTLRYQFAVTYNSKTWDQQVYIYNRFSDCSPPPGSGLPAASAWCGNDYIKSIPSRRSNAGMGWLVSLGRLLSPADPMLDPGPVGTGTPYWTYEAPDGADHAFSFTDPTNANIHHTRDGSFLRLVPASSGQYEVDFPDGLVHSFEPVPGENSYRLRDIRDPFGNHLSVAYDAVGTWTLTEFDAAGTVVRHHYVRFQDATIWATAPQNAPPNYDSVVSQIDIGAFGGRAIYQFQYGSGSTPSAEEIPYGCYGDWRGADTPNPTVPRLRRIVLPDADHSTWQFDYSNNGCSAISELVFPTKGKIDWTYAPYMMPTPGCRSALVPNGDTHDSPYTFSDGVATKKVFANDGTTANWTYAQLSSLSSSYTCQTTSNYALVPKKKQSTVTVTSPDGMKTEYYYSIWIDSASPGNGVYFDQSEYGLPFTRATESNCASAPTAQELCLSSRTYDCSSGTCSPWTRSTFVRYEGESRQPSLSLEDYGYRREVARETKFDDGQRIDVTRSHYDGLGHYRTVTTTDSWSGLSREETTNYNPSAPDVGVNAAWENNPSNNRPPPTSLWLLNLYNSSIVGGNGATFKNEFCFDGSGFLLRRRSLAGSLRQANDFLTIFNRDTNGNLVSEQYFGGDSTQGDTLGACSSTPTAGPAYALTHQYAFGVRKSTQYAGASFKSIDLTIDTNTGLPLTSTDPAGHQTTFQYDALGHLAKTVPTGEAWTEYIYSMAGTPPGVTIKQWPHDAGNTGTPLTEAHHYFDGLGRPVQTRTLFPDGWSVTAQAYDNLGRVITTSSPEYRSGGGFEVFSPAHVTAASYDVFGRVTSVQSADHKTITSTYTGVHMLDRLQTINRAEASVTTHEEYDGLGRLVTIKENANGSPTTTNYGYDAAGNLTAVAMSATGGVTQNRTFAYDGRGMLVSEQHPENGSTCYGAWSSSTCQAAYDARGHALSRQIYGQPKYDLKFTYDAAERLKTVDGRKPRNTTTFFPVKEFGYDDTSSGGLGKLSSAVRHNFIATDIDEMNVTDSYAYDATGHLTKKTTAITQITAGNITPLKTLEQTFQSYDDLGNPAAITAPRCIAPEGTGCGAAVMNSVSQSFSGSTLRSVNGATLQYAPNGAIRDVVHPNGVADHYEPDVNGMSRVKAISFGAYSGCLPPSIVQPSDQSITSGTTAILSASIAGSTPLSVQWYTQGQPISGATGATYTTPPLTQTSYYWVEVFNACGRLRSALVTVSVAALGVPTGVTAVRTGQSQVRIAWNAAASATHYYVDRQANGSVSSIDAGNATTFYDNALPANTTYLYRVRAADSQNHSSGASVADIASIKDFLPIAVNSTTIQAAHFTELLDAVNMVRAVNFSPALGWNQILPAGTPTPASGVSILSTHITALRVAMDNALRGLSLPTYGYADPTLSGMPIRAVHVTDLRGRTKN